MYRQIVSPAMAAGEQAADTKPTDTTTSDKLTVDDYKDKLIKHIPAEAIAVYLTLQGIITSDASPRATTPWLWVAFTVGLAGTPLYLWRLQHVSSWVQLSISTVSFAVWVYGLGGAFARYSWYESWTASVVLIAFTFMVPVVMGNQKHPAPDTKAP